MDRDMLDIFGANIRNQRIKIDLSQEELAHLSGLHRTYIRGVERGKETSDCFMWPGLPKRSTSQ